MIVPPLSENASFGTKYFVLCIVVIPYFKAGNHVVLMIGFTEFHAGSQTKHVRK